MATSSDSALSDGDPYAAERERLFEELWALEDAATGGPWDAVLVDLHTRIEQRLDVIGRD